MTKAELIEKIVDCLIDPWTDCPEDYLYATPIDRCGAVDFIAQIRDDEESCELEPEECLPQEATPELVMEAYNCLIRARKREARIERLAEWIADNDCVCEYANFYAPAHKVSLDIIPVDFVMESDVFPFTSEGEEEPDHTAMLRIGLNSAKTFNVTDEYCWYDKEHEQLFSVSEPFRNGVLDAEAFARFAFEDPDNTLDYFINCLMDEDDFKSVFGCTKEAFANE